MIRIQYLNAAGAWVNVNPTVTATADNTVSPPQGLFRYNVSNLRFPGGVCPGQIRAAFNANNNVNSGGFTPDSR